MAEDFDIGPLTWVKDEIDQALKSVRENLTTFAGKPSDVSVLKFSQTHLYQVSGALDMVGLQGCKRFCTEIEKVVSKLESQALPYSLEVVEKLNQSILALDDYLQVLLAGAPDIPLKLFPALQSLVLLQGETIEETELFFPDTSLRAPKDLPSTEVPEEQLPKYYQAQRSAFQKALLGWLRTSSLASLDDMRTVVDKVQQVQKQSSLKTLWWVTSAFTDALTQKELSENPSVKKLYRQIDQQIKSLSEGSTKASSSLIRDVLYYVALSPAANEKIAKVKSVFELDDLLQQPLTDVPDDTSEMSLLAVLRDLLLPLKNAWSQVTTQKTESLPELANQFVAISHASEPLKSKSLKDLLAALKALMQAMSGDASKLSEDAIIEVATSLNLLDDALKSSGQDAVQQQVVDQTQRLRSMIGESGAEDYSSTVQLGRLDNDVLIAVAKQIKEALTHVEKALDTYFRNPATSNVLDDATKPMKQVIAAFDMLEMVTPTEIAKLSAQIIEFFADESVEQANKSGFFEPVAESLSLLGFFLEEIPRVRPETYSELEAALLRMQAQQPSREVSTASEVVAPIVEAPANIETAEPVQQAFDTEMLEIYISEAEEVLASVAQNLQALRVNTTDTEALIEVRRGFHTLKGSGRMVGLNSLGDVAWCVENLLNKVLEAKQTPSVKQIAFTEKLSAAFAEWVSELRESGTVSLNAESWQAEAQELEHDSDKQKPLAEEVLIDGTRKMSRTLFNIFLGEAKQHLQVLKQESSSLSLVDSSKPSGAFIRSAHTLASNAGATGFTAILDLARALENWLDVHDGRWSAKDLKLADNVVTSLTKMIGVVEGLRQPKRATALLNALKKATERANLVAEHKTADETVASEYTTSVDEGSLDVDGDEAVTDVELDQGVEPATIEELAATVEVDAIESVVNEPEFEATLSDMASVSEIVDELPELVAEEPLTEAIIEGTVVEPVAVESVEMEPATLKNAPNTIDKELHVIFMEEANELLPQIGKELRAWRLEPQNTDNPDELQRLLHTLKGSARMAGQANMGNAVHGMEDRIIKSLQGKVTDLDFDDMFADLDRIGHFLELAGGNTSVADKPADVVKRQVAMADAGTRSNERRAQYLRLRADVLDRLINEAGEISIARARMDQEILGFKQLSLDLTENVLRLRNYLRELEIETESQMQSRMTLLQEAQEAFDPLEFDRFTRLQELTRLMAESVNDVSTIQHSLLMNLDETESALQQQNRMNRELQHGLMDVRMVPFSQISERLHRIVRQTARELKKQVEFVIDGEDVDIDRSVLDKIGAPLEHLLRNAVAHGLETPAQRKKSGKPEQGLITLKVRHENDEIALTVMDDGAGVNLKKVREKAIKIGMFNEKQEVTDQALLTVIFEPGFSTADDVTQIAGRGVGLDAVRGDITSLGGRIDVSNSKSQGAVFNIFLPVTLSVSQVVLVRTGTHLYALPSIMVEQLQKLKANALAEAYQSGHVDWAGRQYPIHFFTKLIGESNQLPEEQVYTPILLLRSGTYHIALHVDEIVGNQEVVMKPIGPQLARLPGIAGATVLGDGRIVIIVNPVQLANRESLTAGSVKAYVETPVVVNKNPVALVVDDSLTMRKVLGRLLERESYQVLLAKDGMDALQVLQEHKPDIILSDIEMPRMDGFEFVRNVRADELHKNVPIIMISSRTAEKHQNHAKELGVNAFLGKPVGDDELIGTMDRLLHLS